MGSPASFRIVTWNIRVPFPRAFHYVFFSGKNSFLRSELSKQGDDLFGGIFISRRFVRHFHIVVTLEY